MTVQNDASTKSKPVIHDFFLFLWPCLMVMMLSLAIGAIIHFVRGVEFLWGPYLIGGLMAGMASSFLNAIVRGWKWVEVTPVYKHWKFLLGEKLVKPVLFVLMLLMFCVGWLAVLAPGIMGKPGTLLPQEPQNPLTNNPGANVSIMKPKSRDMSPGDAGFVDAVLEDMQASSPSRRTAGIQAAARALAGESQPRHKELHDSMMNLLKTGDNTTLILVLTYLPRFGTSDDIVVVNEVMAKNDNSAVKFHCQNVIKSLQNK